VTPTGDATLLDLRPEGSSDWDWSPDLARLVWTEPAAPHDPEQVLMLGSPDGSDPIEIGRLASYLDYGGRAWSGDGSRFAYAASTDDGTELTAVDAATGETTEIARWTWDSSWVDVDWSADATRLAVAIGDGPDQGIWTMAADGTGAKRIFDAHAYRIGWSPTAPLLVAEARTTEAPSAGVWILGIDGSEPHRISPDDDVDLAPVWSPDGSWIAFSRDTTPAGPKDQPQEGTTVFIMRLDGTDTRRVQPVPERGWQEVWAWMPASPAT
jgi:Tol biopolymer transport system component